MAARNTEEWEDLLEDTLPAPWGVKGATRYEGSPDGLWSVKFEPVEPGANFLPQNAELAAAAPEAVAEVVRLRREIEQLRDHFRSREVASRARAGNETDDQEKDHALRFAHHHKRTHEILTRILEGEQS